MSAPWQQVLANVGALNNAQAPFSYWVDGDAIVGYWDVAKSPRSASHRLTASTRSTASL